MNAPRFTQRDAGRSPFPLATTSNGVAFCAAISRIGSQADAQKRRAGRPGLKNDFTGKSQADGMRRAAPNPRSSFASAFRPRIRFE